MSVFHLTNPVARIYRSVIDDVCSNAREGFLDEGLDEQVLMEFKNVWESKVLATKAIDSFSDYLNTPMRNSYVTQMPASGHNMTIPLVTPLQLATPALSSNMALPPALMARSHTGFVLQSLPGGTVRYLHSVNATNRPYLTKVVPARLPTTSPPVSSRAENQVDTSSAAECSNRVYQVDGPAGLSDAEEVVVEEDEEEAEDFNEDEDENEEEDEEDESFVNAGPVEDVDPLNSDDDISFDDDAELFEADNVSACQYEKVTRTRNKWKFVFKDGIMNISGKDYVFNRATGEAEF